VSKNPNLKDEETVISLTLTYIAEPLAIVVYRSKEDSQKLENKNKIAQPTGNGTNMGDGHLQYFCSSLLYFITSARLKSPSFSFPSGLRSHWQRCTSS
jgi:hypothetical protein